MDTQVLLTVLGIVAVALIFKGRGKGGGNRGRTDWSVQPLAPGWHYGPVVHGTNRTHGMPQAKPTRTATGFRTPFPGPGGSLHCVQTRDYSLAGKSEVVVRYRITGSATFTPADDRVKHNPARIVLVLQRNGDDWSSGEKRFHRLYSKAGDVLAPGEFELRVPLTPEALGPVEGGGVEPGHIEAMKADLHSLQIGFGASGGRAHGVYATGQAEFELLGLEIH